MENGRNSGGAGGDRPEWQRPTITLQKQAIYDAIVHARTHMERAEQAAKFAHIMEADAAKAPRGQLSDDLMEEAEKGRQGVTIEHDRAVAAITSMLSIQTGQTVRAIEEPSAPSWTEWVDKVTTVGSLQRLVPEGHPDYDRIVFVDGDDREAVRRYTGAEAEDYGGFFVLVGDGEYDAVWGMEGIVPGLHKSLDRLEVN